MTQAAMMMPLCLSSNAEYFMMISKYPELFYHTCYLLIHVDQSEMLIFELTQRPDNNHSKKAYLSGMHSVDSGQHNLITGQKFDSATLQGPTSSGKTSLVAYLAAQTGHTLVRINNHEQTDLQEYLGSYVSNETGKLVFQEGALVQAVRQGHWLLLDELNLAPSQVLEALNRCVNNMQCMYHVGCEHQPVCKRSA